MNKQSVWTKGLLTVVAAAAMVACGGSDDPVATPASATLVGRYAFAVGEGVSEIVAHHAASQSIFITVDTDARPASFQRIGMRGLTSTDLASPVTASNLDSGATTSVAVDVNDAGFTAGGVQTLAIHGNVLAIAVQATPKTEPGVVAFYRLDSVGNATFLKKVTVGSLPDGIAFSPDGSKLVVANEGELSVNFATDGIDPPGSISIIALSNGTPADTATTLGFEAFNVGGARAAELPTGVRISRPGASVAQDMEPEFVKVADNQTAFVTLQENNAVAVVNLATNTVERIVPMGEKNHGLAGNELAPSDRVDPPFVLKTYNNLFGYYMPDGIDAFSVGNTRYFITANEGDDRNDFLAAEETSRVSALTLDPTAFPNATALKANTELGRLTVFNNAGDTDGDGDFDRLYALGGRSFSIYNASTGAQVYDSGSTLERLVYTSYDTALLNADQVKGRLDNKGPEPENVVVGEVKGKLHAFIGLERSSAVAMFDISNPAAPVFVQLLRNSTNLSDGDISPEGLSFVPASASPTGQALLLVGYEVSGTVAVYELK
jgi:YVTN family beta-propeller protein